VIADEVVDMVAMRHGLVATSGPVHMPGIVRAARVAGLAARRMRRIDRDHALVDVVVVRVVKMAVVQVIDVSVVLDGTMPAFGAVDMLVSVVNRVRAHRESFRG
jgi:hypothetical protein